MCTHEQAHTRYSSVDWGGSSYSLRFRVCLWVKNGSDVSPAFSRTDLASAQRFDSPSEAYGGGGTRDAGVCVLVTHTHTHTGGTTTPMTWYS